MNRPLAVTLWSLMTLLAIGVAGYGLFMVLVPTMRGGFVVDMFRDDPFAAPAHLAGGAIAILLGALQFNQTLRRRVPLVHRWMGRIYVVAVGFSGGAGLFMALTTAGGLAGQYGFSMLAIVWLLSTTMALVRIRQGDIQRHRRWMVRSYALTLAAVSLRIYLPISLANEVPFEAVYAAIAWLCWVPNLIIAEWLILPSMEKRPAR